MLLRVLLLEDDDSALTRERSGVQVRVSLPHLLETHHYAESQIAESMDVRQGKPRPVTSMSPFLFSRIPDYGTRNQM